MGEKELLMDVFKGKLGYCFNYKDLQDIENIINILLQLKQDLGKLQQEKDELKKYKNAFEELEKWCVFEDYKDIFKEVKEKYGIEAK